MLSFCHNTRVWQTDDRQTSTAIPCVYASHSRTVKTVTGKSVNRFPTGNRFSEHITGYRIYRTSRRHNPGNADSGVWPLPRCSGGIWMQPAGLWSEQVAAYPHCAAVAFSQNSSVVAMVWSSISREVKFLFFWHSKFVDKIQIWIWIRFVAKTLVVH